MKISLLSKFTFILFGVFISSTLFAFLLKAFDVAGLWIGLGLSIAIIAAGFYYTKKNTATRYIIWGITGAVVTGTIIFIVGIQMLSGILEKSGF